MLKTYQLAILFFFCCLSTFKQIPMPAINIITDVPPLEINGNGRPVGGIEPFNIGYCTYKFKLIYFYFFKFNLFKFLYTIFIAFII